MCPPFTDKELIKSVERDGKLIKKLKMRHTENQRSRVGTDQTDATDEVPYLFGYFQRMYYWYGYSNDTFVSTRYVCNVLEAYLTSLLHTGDVMADAKIDMHQNVWKDYFGPLEYVFAPAKEHGFSLMENKDMCLRGVMSAEDESDQHSTYFEAYKPPSEENDPPHLW